LLHLQPSENTSLALNLVAESASHFRFSGLDNLGIGTRAQLRQKFGLGSDAPWAAFALSALHRDYHYDYRNGWQYGAGLTAGKAFGERWDLSGSVNYDRYEADTDTLSINWSRAVGRHASVTLGYAYRRTQGDDELDAYTENMINLRVSYSR